jgi:hypothetical protein
MKISAAAVLSVIVALIFISAASLLLSGCAVSLECGSWVFSGTPQSGSSDSNATLANVNSAFTFTPASCGKDCTCDIDAMIQIVAAYDTSEHTYVYPTSSYEARATSNGWSVDQLDGWAYGWYALLNDGSTFDTNYNKVGSNGSANTLYDAPSWFSNVIFFAVDAAVCFKSKSCNNRVLGYYFWGWSVDNNGAAHGPFNGPAWTELETQFQNTVTAWNNWAPTSGQETLGSGFPGQPVLPHAVPFQTMTDL